MLLSESEAKFKFCPLLKTTDDKMKFCLGSGCMMWRRDGDKSKESSDDASGKKGWCGLAGRPLNAGF